MTIKVKNPKTGKDEEAERIEGYFGPYIAAIKFKGRTYHEKDFESEYGKIDLAK